MAVLERVTAARDFKPERSNAAEALILTIENEHTEVCNLLLDLDFDIKKSVQPNDPSKCQGKKPRRTPLKAAVVFGRRAIVKAILAHPGFAHGRSELRGSLFTALRPLSSLS
jgi:hypothetical protein